MVSVHALRRLALLPLLLLALPGCAGGKLVAREVLADPMMRFPPGQPLVAPGQPVPTPDLPIPPNTVSGQVAVSADPGNAVAGLWTDSSLRSAVEIVSGLALEAGYGLRTEKQLVQKLDGFAGPIEDDRLRHGPDGAVVLDDGTSLLRVGYRFRTGWDGDSHEPSVLARTTVLGRDTTVEVGYRRLMRSLQVSADHQPARDPVDASITADTFSAAIEQGFVPGWNLRLDFSASLENGFLQSPFRLVSLWSQRDLPPNVVPVGVPRVEPEHDPDSRVRWGGLFRVRKMLTRISGALEIGGGYGSDNWRVAHAIAEVTYLQRLGDHLILSLGGGGYHQTRASFYRDEYPYGPPGAYWSADPSLCSYIAWFAEATARMMWIPERGRFLGMFKNFNLDIGFRFSRAYYAWEGIKSPDGFTAFTSFAGGNRVNFEGGQVLGAWLAFEGGF